jgi:CRP-like cAMP-binding protein
LCGETEFLTNRERIAEVVAREPATLLILPTEHLAQVIEKDVMIGRTLMKNLASRLAAWTAQRLDVLAGSVVDRSSRHYTTVEERTSHVGTSKEMASAHTNGILRAICLNQPT